MRSWISRSFKNALVCRLVCDGAFSSCHHQLDVSVPRRAMQCGKYTSSSIRMQHSVLMRTRPSMKHGAKTMPFTIASPAWVALAVLVDAHVGIEISLSCRSPVGSNHPNWLVLRVSKNTTRQRHDPWCKSSKHVSDQAQSARSKEEVKNCLSNHHHPSSS